MPITTPPEEDRATVIGNFVEDRTCSSEDMIADRQTHRHTDTLITILRSFIANILWICGNFMNAVGRFK